MKLPIPGMIKKLGKKLAFKVAKTDFGQRVGLDLMAEFAKSVDPDESMFLPMRVLAAALAFNDSSNVSLAGKALKSTFRVFLHKDDVSKRSKALAAAPAPL